METVARFMQLVDRESATFVGIAFCETEDEMRRADEALNRMSPGEEGGGRTAVDIFEVAIDEAFAKSALYGLRPAGRRRGDLAAAGSTAAAPGRAPL